MCWCVCVLVCLLAGCVSVWSCYSGSHQQVRVHPSTFTHTCTLHVHTMSQCLCELVFLNTCLSGRTSQPLMIWRSPCPRWFLLWDCHIPYHIDRFVLSAYILALQSHAHVYVQIPPECSFSSCFQVLCCVALSFFWSVILYTCVHHIVVCTLYYHVHVVIQAKANAYMCNQGDQPISADQAAWAVFESGLHGWQSYLNSTICLACTCMYIPVWLSR